MMEWEEELKAWKDKMSSAESSNTGQNEIDSGASVLEARNVFRPVSGTYRKSLIQLSVLLE